jgi:anti-sigma factor RsiW
MTTSSHEGEIACVELVELVTAYLENALSADDRVRFEQHLAICEGCDAYLEQMRETIRLSGTLREEQLDGEARGALLHAFRSWAAR